MSRIQAKFNPNDYEPRRFGLKYDPPQIIMEYFVPSSNKLKHHKIKLPKLKPESKIDEIIKEIYEKHSIYLDQSKVPQKQILNLVDKLKDNLKHINNKNYLLDQDQEHSEEINHNTKINSIKEENEEDDPYSKFDNSEVDLNKLEIDDINKIKEKMEKAFENHSIKPCDPEYKYDVRKDFNKNKIDPEWDSFDIEEIDEDSRF